MHTYLSIDWYVRSKTPPCYPLPLVRLCMLLADSPSLLSVRTLSTFFQTQMKENTNIFSFLTLYFAY